MPARPFGNTGYFARMRGMVTVKVLPSPLTEATSILPPCCMTTWRATYRPMPVPPLPYDEKNRVNSLVRVSSVMPMPLSSMRTSTASGSPLTLTRT